MDAKTLEEGKALLAEFKRNPFNRENESNLFLWFESHGDELIADAVRLETLVAGFRIMSPKMDGNHVWTWSHHPKLVGPNMKTAIDTAIAAGEKTK